MPDLSRRSFLKLSSGAALTASGLLGLAGLLRFLGFQPEPAAPTVLDVGLAADYPPGSCTHLPDIPAVLRHDQDGFSAFSLTCTHLGCTVKSDESGWTCPCHGSRYGQAGEVQRGPAEESLAELRVEVADDGHLMIATG